MKKIRNISIIVTVVLFTFSACAQKMEKIPADKVNPDKVELAKQFNDEFFEKSAKGDTMDFEGRITKEMEMVFSPDKQMTLYNQFKSQLGDYEGCEFTEAWYVNMMQEYDVYRFYGKFSNQQGKWEIRVVLDNDDLVAGYYIKPWSDIFK